MEVISNSSSFSRFHMRVNTLLFGERKELLPRPRVSVMERDGDGCDGTGLQDGGEGKSSLPAVGWKTSA